MAIDCCLSKNVENFLQNCPQATLAQLQLFPFLISAQPDIKYKNISNKRYNVVENGGEFTSLYTNIFPKAFASVSASALFYYRWASVSLPNQTLIYYPNCIHVATVAVLDRYYSVGLQH